MLVFSFHNTILLGSFRARCLMDNAFGFNKGGEGGEIGSIISSKAFESSGELIFNVSQKIG